ncbi:MAG TPA: right-handed parallel beta-helix repeat-containing protein [Acidimicrobiia bacterium]
MTRRASRLLATVVVVGGALILLAVFGPAARGSAAPAAAPRPAADDYTETAVTMQDNAFLPQTLTVDPGTVVRWDNDGRNKHNVIPDHAASVGWKSPTIPPHKSYEHRMDTPGVYGYFCSFHGAPGKGMYGTIIVKNADGTIPAAASHRAPRTTTGRPRTIHVPKDVGHIQEAVDRAPAGSLILLSPGVYREAVTVTTDRLVIRGLDRNRTILDGGFRLDNGIKVLGASGVTIENMTARNYTKNGFFWTGAKGYRGSYLTATRTGDYAIYAFDSVDGKLDHDYGSGSPDAGFYIGQCFPCNSIVTHVLAEYNGIGFSGTNAGGDLVITNSTWRRNRVGIVPNSEDGEKNPPQHDATIVGNLVYDNNNSKTPAIDDALLAEGNGILVAGGVHDLVTHNRVFDHDLAGIVIVPYPGGSVWFPYDNQVVDNLVYRSHVGDLGWFGGSGNCFAGNHFTTSTPSNIERVLPCSGPAVPATDSLDIQKYLDAKHPKSVDYRKAKTPKPPRLPGMRHPANAKARPAVGIVVHIDASTVPTPKAPKRSGS